VTAALVSMRCRSTLRPDTASGLDALAGALGRRLNKDARAIGTPRDEPAAEFAEVRGCLLEAGGQLEDALDAGVRPLLLAGDGAIALTTLPAIAGQRPDARVLWLDAHACFHLPAAGRRLERTALAGACGRWDTGFAGALAPERLVLCGTRAIDDGERGRLDAPRVRVIGTTLETLVHLQHALDGAPTYVHLDVDVLDEAAMPLAESVPGGLPAEKLLDLLDAVADSCEVLGLEVCGFAPSGEIEAREELAEVVGSVLEPLLASLTADDGT
jgi:arginase